jgi:hypothetical protein
MMRRAMVTAAAALAGLVIMLSGRTVTAAPPVPTKCFLCSCQNAPVTACFNSDPDDKCPACPPDTLTLIELSPDPCNEIDECRPFLSRAPALSHVPLAGLGVLLVVGGILLTRKRSTVS